MHFCAKISAIKVDNHNKFGLQINKQLLHNEDLENAKTYLVNSEFPEYAFIVFPTVGWGYVTYHMLPL